MASKTEVTGITVLDLKSWIERVELALDEIAAPEKINVTFFYGKIMLEFGKETYILEERK